MNDWHLQCGTTTCRDMWYWSSSYYHFLWPLIVINTLCFLLLLFPLILVRVSLIPCTRTIPSTSELEAWVSSISIASFSIMPSNTNFDNPFGKHVYFINAYHDNMNACSLPLIYKRNVWHIILKCWYELNQPFLNDTFYMKKIVYESWILNMLFPSFVLIMHHCYLTVKLYGHAKLFFNVSFARLHDEEV